MNPSRHSAGADSAPDNLIENPLDREKRQREGVREKPTPKPHDPGEKLITNPLDKPGGGDNLIPNPLDKR